MERASETWCSFLTMAAVARTHSSRGSNTRKAQLSSVVLPLLLSHDSRLFTLCCFEATPPQDAIGSVAV